MARERASARARVGGGECKGAGSNAKGGSGAKGEARGENWVGTKTKAGLGAEICRYIHVGVHSDSCGEFIRRSKALWDQK